MRTRHAATAFALAGLLGLLAASCADDSDPEPTAAPGGAADVCPTEGDEWEEAKLYVEHNATDEDTGLHGLLGGEPWRSLCVTSPDGERLWTVTPEGALRDLGVSDLFFESNEPPNDEYSVDDLRADFPEGAYTVAGVDVDGSARVGEAEFTHDIPVAPEITGPELVEEPEEAGAAVPTDGLVVTWEPVTETIDGDPVTITAYEVIVTMEEFEDPNGLSRPVYDVHVGPDVTELPVPAEFLEPDTIYELEILALEESGNQTISVGFFRTA